MRINLDKITKSFKKVEVLQEINLDARLRIHMRSEIKKIQHDLEIGNKEGLPFKVYTIEPTGRDDVIICENNGSMFTCLAIPGHNIKEGENVKVSFDMEKVQFFDTDTEKSILWE